MPASPREPGLAIHQVERDALLRLSRIPDPAGDAARPNLVDRALEMVRRRHGSAWCQGLRLLSGLRPCRFGSVGTCLRSANRLGRSLSTNSDRSCSRSQCERR
jgi:hypothetical protein